MTRVDLADIEWRLCQEGRVDLLRGVACPR